LLYFILIWKKEVVGTKGKGAREFSDLELSEIFQNVERNAYGLLILLDAVIGYYVGLRPEERLRLSKQDFDFKDEINGVIYVFRGVRKNDQLATNTDWIPVLKNEQSNLLDPTQIIKEYFQLIPGKIKDSDRIFLHPNKSNTGFTRRPIGKNTLYKLPKDAASHCNGIEDPNIYTPNSYRKSQATIAVEKGNDNNAVMKFTGHKSEEAFQELIDYERKINENLDDKDLEIIEKDNVDDEVIFIPETQPEQIEENLKNRRKKNFINETTPLKINSRSDIILEDKIKGFEQSKYSSNKYNIFDDVDDVEEQIEDDITNNIARKFKSNIEIEIEFMDEDFIEEIDNHLSSFKINNS